MTSPGGHVTPGVRLVRRRPARAYWARCRHSWRDAGFSAADTFELLWADAALTPDGAHAFDRVGTASQRRAEWISYGFDAADAARWAAAGLTPEEVRLWRACGKQAGDVPAGERVPPQLTVGRRGHTYATSGPADGARSDPEWDHLADPPGTRGRRARLG